MEQNSGAGRSSGARLEDGPQGTPSSLLRPSNGSEFQPSQNTGSSMAKLPSKARPCFASTLVEDVSRASSSHWGCCFCLQQAGCTLPAAYKNVPDIAKQRAMVFLPGTSCTW